MSHRKKEVQETQDLVEKGNSVREGQKEKMASVYIYMV